MEIDELKKRFLNKDFDEREFEADAEAMVEFARAVGEDAPRFTDPAHPDFQAAPTFAARFHGRRMLPDDFPDFDRRMMIDAGKAVEWLAPIRPGDVLTANSHLHDVYEKTGRSGPMLFLVHRMEFSNARGELTSRVDWRLIIRGGVS